MSETAHVRTRQGPLQNILQVCVVVEDLREAMRHYWEVLGIGPWKIYTFEPPDLTDTTLRGAPEPYSMKVGLAQIGNVQWELIQPLTGRSTYREFLEQKGGGLHHVLVQVENYDDTLKELQKRDIGVLMGGSWRGATYAYADTEKSLGTVLEFCKVSPGWVMSEPEEIYPLMKE